MIPEHTTDEEPTWGYTDLGIFLFLSFLAVVATQFLTYALAKAFRLDKNDLTQFLLPSQLVLYVLLFAVLFAIIKLQYGRGFWESLGWVAPSIRIESAALAGVGLAFAVAILGVALRTPDVDTPMKHLLSKRSTAIEFAIMGTTIGPLCEELVFRGFMQPVLVRSLGPALGILVTAIVFGALHLSQNAFTWQAGVLIALAGMAFGWMRQLSGSTRASTLMHASYNFTFFLTLLAHK